MGRGGLGGADAGVGQPSARAEHAMAYDGARGRVVLFGGDDAAYGTRRTRRSGTGRPGERTPTAGSPPARYRHAMAYDSARGRVVLFGGSAAPGALQDTWEWDGQAWAERTPASGNPPARYGHAMAYDSARGRVVLFGGDDSTGTELGRTPGSGTGRHGWSGFRPRAAPAARSARHGLRQRTRARRPLRGLSGASRHGVQDAWEWDGERWIERTPTSGSSRARVARHGVRQRAGQVVLFGGNVIRASADTWEWDGEAWVERTPASGSPPLCGHAMATTARASAWSCSGPDSPAAGHVGVGRGGLGGGTPRRSPPRADGHAMAYDSARGRVVLFGGRDSPVVMQDTWEYVRGADRQPAFQFTVSAAAAGFAPADVSGLRVRAHCGGTLRAVRRGRGGRHAPGLGDRRPGPARRAAGRRSPPTSTGAAPTSPHLPAPPAALLDWTSAAADEARRLPLERDRKLAFQCRPSGASGEGDATVALDYLEVRVRYSAPCNAGGECESGFCNREHGHCTDGGNGAPCLDGADCASGTCGPRNACGRIEGEACASGRDCRLGLLQSAQRQVHRWRVLGWLPGRAGLPVARLPVVPHLRCREWRRVRLGRRVRLRRATATG